MTNARTAKSTREKAAQLRAESARKEARRRSAIALAIVTVIIAVIAATFVLVRSNSHPAAAFVTPANLNSTGAIVVGKASAPVTMVAYEDFQCPACQEFEATNSTQINAWIKAGTLKVEYHPIAFLNQMSTTNYSTRALNVAAAVVNSSPSSFAAFHAALYDNQPKEGSAGLTDDQLIGYAVEAGAPKAAIATAASKGTYDAWAAQVTDAASKAKVVQTPTLLVNGQKLADHDPATVKAAVEAAAK